MLFFHPTLTLLNSTLLHQLASCLRWEQETLRNKTRTILLSSMELSTPVEQVELSQVEPVELSQDIFW